MKLTFEVPALDKIARSLEGINHSLRRLVFVAGKIEEALTPPSAHRVVFYVEEDGKLTRLGGIMFQKVTEAKKFVIKITDRFGNDAKVDGAPAWAATDASLVDVAVAADGMSAVVTPKGQVGSLKLQVNADADMGEGVKPLLGEVDIDLLPGDAEVIAISEAPLEEPAPEEPAPEEPAPAE